MKGTPFPSLQLMKRRIFLTNKASKNQFNPSMHAFKSPLLPVNVIYM